MTTPTPQPDDAIREALQRDAARLPVPPFDARLHQDAMRRIRSLTEPAPGSASFRPRYALASLAALLALVVLLALCWPRFSPKIDLAADLGPQPAAPRDSLLTYQAAARNGDDALFAI